jgi:hypothetical protein
MEHFTNQSRGPDPAFQFCASRILRIQIENWRCSPDVLKAYARFPDSSCCPAGSPARPGSRCGGASIFQPHVGCHQAATTAQCTPAACTAPATKSCARWLSAELLGQVGTCFPALALHVRSESSESEPKGAICRHPCAGCDAAVIPACAWDREEASRARC